MRKAVYVAKMIYSPFDEDIVRSNLEGKIENFVNNGLADSFNITNGLKLKFPYEKPSTAKAHRAFGNDVRVRIVDDELDKLFSEIDDVEYLAYYCDLAVNYHAGYWLARIISDEKNTELITKQLDAKAVCYKVIPLLF